MNPVIIEAYGAFTTNSIEPVMEDDAVVALDIDNELSYAMEGIISTVQNIAERKDPTTIFEGGDALWPVQALELREVLMHAKYAETGSDSTGRISVAQARRVGSYITLLNSNVHNRTLFSSTFNRGRQQMRPRDPAPVRYLESLPTRRRAQRNYADNEWRKYRQDVANMENWETQWPIAEGRNALGFEAAAYMLSIIGSEPQEISE